MADGNVARRAVGNHVRDEEGREAGRAVAAVEGNALVLQGIQPADAGAPDHAYPVLVNAVFVEPGIGNGLVGGDDGELREHVHFPTLFAVEVIIGIVVLYFAGKAGFELGWLETGDGRGATAAGARPSQ